MSGAVAVFDLDGTITRGDTYLAFLLHVLRRRPRRLFRSAGLPLAAARFALGDGSNDQLKSLFLATIAGGCTRQEMAAYTESFLPTYMRRKIKPEALTRIEWHRSRGHRLILASASLDLYTVPLSGLLRFDTTISTRAAWRGDVLTGALEGENLRGPAKLSAVRAAIEGAGTRPEVFAYSDHHSDLPLLRFADHAVAVDPDTRLRVSAIADGMAIEYWK